MEGGLDMATRKRLANRFRAEYARGTKKQKGEVLDRLVAQARFGRPATAGRRCRACRGAAKQKGADMRNSEEGPRGGLVVWLMVVIVVSLAARIDTITADIAVLSITAYVIRPHSRS
ncbi:hypothetical protein [Bifidobacterium pullorum]|uniref:hypothetical protein n=2 Tax=Bifidobacterium TaxID=1678 RepID=UPI0025985B19|nr:hypothetical protein [uncultured Bifidobacterium sp.]